MPRDRRGASFHSASTLSRCTPRLKIEANASLRWSNSRLPSWASACGIRCRRIDRPVKRSATAIASWRLSASGPPKSITAGGSGSTVNAASNCATSSTPTHRRFASPFAEHRHLAGVKIEATDRTDVDLLERIRSHDDRLHPRATHEAAFGAEPHAFQWTGPRLVDAGEGDVDETLDTFAVGCLDQRRHPGLVHVKDRGLVLTAGEPATDHRGRGDHSVDAPARSRQACVVGEVAADHFDPLAPYAVDLRPGTEEAPDLLAAFRQKLHDPATELAGASDEQDQSVAPCLAAVVYLEGKHGPAASTAAAGVSRTPEGAIFRVLGNARLSRGLAMPPRTPLCPLSHDSAAPVSRPWQPRQSDRCELACHIRAISNGTRGCFGGSDGREWSGGCHDRHTL